MNTPYTPHFERMIRLPQDLKNPSYNKRRKWGLNARQGLPAGTLLYVSSASGSPSIYNEDGEPFCEAHTPFGKAILAAGEEHAPQDWRQYAIRELGDLGYSEDIIDILLREGKISDEAVRQAAAVVAQEWADFHSERKDD